jgi:TRAP-type C4-dicarboxylate transport system permease small subunit
MNNDQQEHGSPNIADPGADPHAGALGRWINSLGIVFAIGILASAGILVIEVLLRYVFNAPTIWAHETVIFLNAMAFVFGGLYAVSRDAHIRVVLIYDILARKTKRLFNIGISLVCLGATIFFAWAAWFGVERSIWTPAGEFRLQTSGSAWNPPTPGLLKVFLFVIFILMAIQFLILTVSYFLDKEN